MCQNADITGMSSSRCDSYKALSQGDNTPILRTIYGRERNKIGKATQTEVSCGSAHKGCFVIQLQSLTEFLFGLIPLRQFASVPPKTYYVEECEAEMFHK